MKEFPQDDFFKSAVRYYGDDSISVEALYSSICSDPLVYSGTSVAIYQMHTAPSPTLLKVFSRNWSRHTKDFCRWAYGAELHRAEVLSLSVSLKTYIEKITDYGLEVDSPVSVWGIPDPFQQKPNERALAIAVREYTAPSIRRVLFDLREDEDRMQTIFKHHIALLLHVIRRAEEHGDVSEYVIRYGVDLKPRNLILGERWIYIDLSPILTPKEMKGLIKNAPLKALRKRFDSRYYIFDLLFRYYKIVPGMNATLMEIARTEIGNALGSNADEYTQFLSNSMNAYIAKWGHMPPDNDWRHPLLG